MKERATPRTQRAREKKKEIFDVAMKMFEELGYEQTTVRDICRSAGITTSSFYHFFGDKLGVLLELYYEILARGAAFLEPAEERLAAPYQSICDYFTAMSDFTDRFSRDVVEQAVMSVRPLTSGGYDALPKDNTLNRIAVFLSEARKRGTVKQDADVRSEAEYLLMGANGVLLYWIMFTDSERYIDVAGRLMPRLFSAVTDEPVLVRENGGKL